MPKRINKPQSFTVTDVNPNVLIPLDELDLPRSCSTIITISRGWRWRITRTGIFTAQPNGRFCFPVKIEYLDGENKGKTREGTVSDYTKRGRYGIIQKV